MTSELTKKTVKAKTQPVKDRIKKSEQQATERPDVDVLDVLAKRAIVALAELLKK